MAAYQSISVDEESAQYPRGPKRSNNHRYIVISFLTLALITTSFYALSRRNDGKAKSADEKYYSTKASSTNVPMPTGVNLGSWVRCLLSCISSLDTSYTIITLSLTSFVSFCSFTRSCPSKIGSTLVTMAQ